jgi:hypothetical protein
MRFRLLLKALFDPGIDKASCCLAVVFTRSRFTISGEADMRKRLQGNDAFSRKIGIVCQSSSLLQAPPSTPQSKDWSETVQQSNQPMITHEVVGAELIGRKRERGNQIVSPCCKHWHERL